MDVPLDPEPAIGDLPPRTYIEPGLPGRPPPPAPDVWIREGLWLRVYDDEGEYRGDADWPRIAPGAVQ